MPAQAPLISIAISTYNGSKYLAEQLDSVFDQTYPNIEVVVVDDASTDDTMQVLQQYSQRFSNLHIYPNRSNLGYIKSFERAIALSKGAYIAPCDQDDVWMKNKVQTMYDNIGDYPLAYCDSVMVDQHLKPLAKTMSSIKSLRTYDDVLVFATDNCIAGHATLFTRQLFDLAAPFHSTVPHDYWLAFIASMNGGVKYIDQQLVLYRNHPTNVIGAVNVTGKKKSREEKQAKKKKEHQKILERIDAFAKACKDELVEEKEVINKLKKCYSSFSFSNNLERVRLFLKYRDRLLAIKKRSQLRKTIFCYKMFWKIK